MSPFLASYENQWASNSCSLPQPRASVMVATALGQIDLSLLHPLCHYQHLYVSDYWPTAFDTKLQAQMISHIKRSQLLAGNGKAAQGVLGAPDAGDGRGGWVKAPPSKGYRSRLNGGRGSRGPMVVSPTEKARKAHNEAVRKDAKARSLDSSVPRIVCHWLRPRNLRQLLQFLLVHLCTEVS